MQEIDKMNEIKEKLEKNQMSLLIGAGFSKNANLKFPSWQELILDIIIELYNKRKPEEQQKIIYNVGYLRIFDDYIKRKGHRESITCYIEKKIRLILNEDNIDLSLHKKILDLPWNNIYTTNYDDLNERANFLLGNIYTVIKNSWDLSFKPRGRIIKLHGDLRLKDTDSFGFDGDTRHHYIISKDDYESYPIRHEAFTQLMRIALLQESFCLIGFSGDDPNFIGWLNWVKDVLEKSKKEGTQHKVYLIDISDKELENSLELFYRNHCICHIKLKEIFGGLGIKDLFGKFIDNLLTTNRKVSNNSRVNSYISGPKDYSSLLYYFIKEKSDLNDLLNHYEEIKKYASVYYLPPQTALKYEYESIITKYREKVISKIKEITDSDLIIEVLGKFSLFIKHSFFNLDNIYNSEDLEFILSKYNSVEFEKIKNKNYWIDFSLLLLSHFKKSNDVSKFDTLGKDILSKTNDISVTNRVNYEKGLRYILNLDIDGLEHFINKWCPENQNDIVTEWLVKKAYLLSYFIQSEYLDQARQLLWRAYNNCNNDAEKLWITELLSYYEMSHRFTRDEKLDFEIDSLKSKGFYDLRSLVKTLIPKQKMHKIMPYEVQRYKYTKSIPIGMSGEDKNRWDCLRLLSFLHEAAIPIYLPNILFITKEEWIEINSLLCEEFYFDLLPFYYQYVRGNRDLKEEFISSLFQKILYSKSVAITEKELMYNCFESINKYYFSREIFFSFFINVLPYFSNVIETKKWESSFLQIWEEKSNINNYILWNDFNNYDKKIQKLISSIEQEQTKSVVLTKLIKENDEKRIDHLLLYLSSFFNSFGKTVLRGILKSLIYNYVHEVISSTTITKIDFCKIVVFIEYIDKEKRIELIELN